ncbi:MAG: hypothetical protein IPJ71_15135 [Bdellovibrionales bacterium]|nr:hypothetical protein [Bdellovibrionales bacterium]
MKVEWNRDKNEKILSTDTNGDGKPDIFDYFSADGSLRERREDRNLDEKFDKITLFPVHPNDKLTTKSDDNFDGIFERIEERYQEGEYIVIHIKIDTKSRGVFDFETTDRVKQDKSLELEGKGKVRSTNKKKENVLDKNHPITSFDSSSFNLSLFRNKALKAEDNGNCTIQSSTRKQLKNIQGLSKLFSDVATIGPLSDGFYLTDFGYKIQKACVELIGSEEIVKIISNSLKRGLACLWQLESPQSRANVHKIASLLLDEKNPPKLSATKLNIIGAERLSPTDLYLETRITH